MTSNDLHRSYNAAYQLCARYLNVATKEDFLEAAHEAIALDGLAREVTFVTLRNMEEKAFGYTLAMRDSIIWKAYIKHIDGHFYRKPKRAAGQDFNKSR
ncbi:MAG: hypothetical protein FWE33_04585 [Defluviitaleaceae bacterium]|nr:hypothetical protein [Defluviitaleaceae bacterium]